MATHSASKLRPPPRDGLGRLLQGCRRLLGILVAVLGFFALLMWADARKADDSATWPQPRRRARPPLTAPTTTPRFRSTASPASFPRTPTRSPSARRH